MRKIKILDVTLRDGGCVNDFNFGQVYMDRILKAQENAGIDVIELGYLDNIAGSESGRTKFLSEKNIYSNFLKEKKDGITYVAMIDYGRYDIESLEPNSIRGIDGIRLAFHKKDYLSAIKEGRKILQKGYKLYLQPMITLRYSDRELLDLIDLANKEIPNMEAFYIVDSFGEMRANDLNRIWNIIDHNLNKHINVGFHSHNNLQLSYSNAMEFIRISDSRNIYIDSSIMGMGKGAGNLNTELLLQHLILTMEAEYKISPLLEVMDKVVNQLKDEYNWGYAPEFYLSAINGCSPSYASYFYEKHMLPIDFVNNLLRSIEEEKKISFDKIYAETLYKKYNEENNIDDKESVNFIKEQIAEKTVLLIAPGKSITNNYNEISKYIDNKEEIFSIGLNIINDLNVNYVLTTRVDVLHEMITKRKKAIATSNICKIESEKVRILNYADWIIEKDKIYDSSFVISLKLLKYCNVKKILLAGFDGFSKDINDNYYDAFLRHPLKGKQVKEYNSFYKELIQAYRDDGISIIFLTPSKYE